MLVALAIKNQYAYQNLVSDNVSIIVLIAVKLEQLTSFFAVGLHPTSSKDPFALRRSTLAIIRTLYANNLDVDLNISDVKLLEFFKSRLIIFLQDELKLANKKIISALITNQSVNEIAKSVLNIKQQDDFLQENEVVANAYKRVKNLIKGYDANKMDFSQDLANEQELRVFMCISKLKNLEDIIPLSQAIQDFLILKE